MSALAVVGLWLGGAILIVVVFNAAGRRDRADRAWLAERHDTAKRDGKGCGCGRPGC